jgi:sugar phosphate permease
VNASEKWLTMLLLCASGSVIFWLPFLSETYYAPMQNTFGFSNTQIGILLSTFGFMSLVGYFPGGWLADRFPPRRLITVALLITSAGGFVFSTVPSFEICVLVYGTWGLATAMVFWSAMIKATRNWGSKEEQGRAFGFLEGGRSITDMAAGTVILAIFAFRGGDYVALTEIIQLQALVPLVLAIIVWLLMKDVKARDEESEEGRAIFKSKDLRAVIRMPIVWLLSIIIMAAYSGMWGAVYLTPFATDIFALGDVLGGAIGIGKYWLAPIAAIAAGFIADKIGTAKAVVGSFILMTIGFLIFGLIPGAPNLVPLLLINVAIISGAVFALRGIYFALLEQGGIPLAITGTAAGLVSVIGYTPDIFIPPLAGIILDAYPGAQGYQTFFLLISGMSFLGLVAAYIAYRKIQSPNWPEIP